jgi:hypothetical protein
MTYKKLIAFTLARSTAPKLLTMMTTEGHGNLIMQCESNDVNGKTAKNSFKWYSSRYPWTLT